MKKKTMGFGMAAMMDGSDDGGSFDDGLRAECGNRRK